MPKRNAILFALVAALLWCAPASAFTKVQATGNAAFGPVTTLTTNNFASSVTTGDTIVCGFQADINAGDTPSVNDSAGNGPYNVTAWALSGGSVGLFIAWKGNVTGGASFNVTATNSVSRSNWAGVCEEWSGVNASANPADVTPAAGNVQTAPGTTTNAITSSAETTVTNGDLLIGITGDTGTGGTGQSTTCPSSAGTSSVTYALGSASTTFNGAVACVQTENAVQSTAGASTLATFTQGTNNGAITFLLALKAPGGGGGATIKTQPMSLMGAGN